MNLTYTRDFSQDEISYLKTLSKADLEQHLKNSELAEVAGNTAQINRKLLINSLYGALTK